MNDIPNTDKLFLIFTELAGRSATPPLRAMREFGLPTTPRAITLYFTLTDRNERGDILAQVHGVIWRNRAELITAKFQEATGDGIKTDSGNDFRVGPMTTNTRVDLKVPYAENDQTKVIEDVDPSYTLGDLAAKLARIREKLQLTGLYARNKQLPAPPDFRLSV